MRTLTIIFHLPSGKIFEVVTLGKTPFTRHTADEAFRLDCIGSVHVDGKRLEEVATTTEQLSALISTALATTKGARSCPSCSL